MANQTCVRILLSTRLAGWRDVTATSGQFMRHLSSSSAWQSSSSLSAGESYQAMAADQKTIVCYHSPKPVPISGTKPLRKRKVWENIRLTDEEVNLVRKLRKEDSAVWSVATLSRLFKISPTVISRVAPTSVERQMQLEEEKELLAKMRPHKRKLYLLQRQASHQNKLKELIAANKYSFPATKTEPN